MTASEMSCQEIIDLVSDYLDGALSPPERARFEGHISGCDGCSNAVEQFRRTVWTAGRVPQDEVPYQLRDALLAALRTRSLDAGS